MINEHTQGFFPLTNPVLIFSLLLFVILVTPYIFKRIKIPHLAGLIIAGSIIGPYGINFLNHDDSIKLYGTVGLLYIMFIAGLEIDLADFKKNSHKSVVFGLYTFLIPMILGTISGLYILNLPICTAILMASIFASHTLVTYPIVTRYEVSKNSAVNITVGGTMITDILALLVLAIIVGITKSKDGLSSQFWINLVLYFSIFTFIVTYIFPKIARQFLKKESDNISQYLFILGLVFLAGYLAEISGVEAIIGAFLAGLSLNQLIPETSPLKNRIEFIGNALFIPIFLIGVGMLINFKVFFIDSRTIFVGLLMIVVATISKLFAAFLTAKTFKFDKNQFLLTFGLSNSQAAATLAAVMVGYNITFTPSGATEPIRLISEHILDGTILMILATCTIASFATEKSAKNIAKTQKTKQYEQDEKLKEKILIPVCHPDTLEELIHLGLLLKDKKQSDNIYALNILSTYNANSEQEKAAKILLEKAAKIVSATDQKLIELLRYDINISNGIYNVVQEHKITDIIIGLHQKKNISDSFLGSLTEGILSNCNANTYIYHSIQPFNTMNKLVVVIPQHSEKEPGFTNIIQKIWNLAENNANKFVIFAPEKINNIFINNQKKKAIEIELINFSDWEDFLIISSKLQDNDGLLIVMSRPGHISRNNTMNKISRYLNKYFENNNYILAYPIQSDIKLEEVPTGSRFFSFRNNIPQL